jgi:hypothetical protein
VLQAITLANSSQNTFSQDLNVVTDKVDEAKIPLPKKSKATTYPGKNDGRISASKNANMRTGASRPGPKKK